MSVLSTLGRIARDYSAARARHLTERTIRSLPLELQKDIGWPDSLADRSVCRLEIGCWAGGR